MYTVGVMAAKMRSGQPLTDEDRMPWLALLAGAIRKHASADKPTVFACSALKRKYRDVLAAKAASGSPAHVLFVSCQHLRSVSICSPGSWPLQAGQSVLSANVLHAGAGSIAAAVRCAAGKTGGTMENRSAGCCLHWL
jgi:hypothetical protein